MKSTTILCILSAGLSAVTFSAVAIAQFVPPPPSKEWGTSQSAAAAAENFTETDRKMLRQIVAYTRSIRAKLFPYQEEQNILELRN